MEELYSEAQENGNDEVVTYLQDCSGQGQNLSVPALSAFFEPRRSKVRSLNLTRTSKGPSLGPGDDMRLLVIPVPSCANLVCTGKTTSHP